MKRFPLALALLLGFAPAWAGNYNAMPTPDQDQKVPIFAIACQDVQGRALPPGSAACAAAQPQTVQGAVTSNQGAPNAGCAAAWYVQWANQSVAVSALPPLPAGTNTIGKFGIDQTTPGTTNGVVEASAAQILARTPPLTPAGAVPVATSTPATIVTGQVKIATTGTAVQLPAAALQNGLVVKAKATNAAQTASYSAAVGPSTVTTVFDGIGTGYALAPGEATFFSTSNSSAIYVNGTAGDVFTYEGN